MKNSIKTRLAGVLIAATALTGFGLSTASSASAHATCSNHQEFYGLLNQTKYEVVNRSYGPGYVVCTSKKYRITALKPYWHYVGTVSARYW